ncbi:tetratricopeptide repeat protein [Vibrio metschnikovii]|uniref:tetratricopeptide repeat protein n=1 Tax=Vibrio metschnikovii TaxID=28172 RepID=UPI00164CB2AF|nr:hypothetical protein [Vibrio metschnikovii]MBC5833150.1 hypothetical protein [Vibrio metschnikovii]
MYEILVNIQHGKMDSAYDQLHQLVEQDDPEAMFWFAKMIYEASILSRPRAIDYYKISANQGYPYSFYELSPKGKGCLLYFGDKVCKQENLDKAIKGFEQLAEQGDLRAQYFLLQQKQWDQSTKTREQYLNEVIRFAKAHYYQPLMDYIDPSFRS